VATAAVTELVVASVFCSAVFWLDCSATAVPVASRGPGQVDEVIDHPGRRHELAAGAVHRGERALFHHHPVVALQAVQRPPVVALGSPVKVPEVGHLAALAIDLGLVGDAGPTSRPRGRRRRAGGQLGQFGLADLLGQEGVKRLLALGHLGVGRVAGRRRGLDRLNGQVGVGAERHQGVLLLGAGAQRGGQILAAALDELGERHGSAFLSWLE
jgi:hypothetical protein